MKTTIRAMGKPEFTVIGPWAIRHSTGAIRCLLCKRACVYFEQGIGQFHSCDYIRDQTGEGKVTIPDMVAMLATNYKQINNAPK